MPRKDLLFRMRRAALLLATAVLALSACGRRPSEPRPEPAPAPVNVVPSKPPGWADPPSGLAATPKPPEPPKAIPQTPGTPTPPGKPVRPNILLVIGDDHGYPFYGFMGHKVVKTPVMDKLVREGALFPFCHNSSPACMASLETILVGLYPKDFSAGKTPTDYTMPKALKPAGYATYGIGKFWSGFGKRGFDDYVQKSNMLIARRTMEPIFDYIDGHLDKPFFAWYAPRLPHVPLNAPQKYRDLYPNEEKEAQGYYANISWFDEKLGELVAHLEKRKIRDRTLILYVSDNGYFLPKSKSVFGENGYRTVLFANFPGVIPPGLRYEDKLTHTIDILPTFLDYAGLPARKELEGRSLRPLLEGKKETPWRKYLFGQDTRGSSRRSPASNRYAVNPDRMKLYTERNQLFDLKSDPNEDKNLIADPNYKALVDELRRAVEGWTRREDDGAAPPPENPQEESEEESRAWNERLQRLDLELRTLQAKAPDEPERDRIQAYRDIAYDTWGCAVRDLGDIRESIRLSMEDNGFGLHNLPKP